MTANQDSRESRAKKENQGQLTRSLKGSQDIQVSVERITDDHQSNLQMTIKFTDVTDVTDVTAVGLKPFAEYF